jgi:hypothetical protein
MRRLSAAVAVLAAVGGLSAGLATGGPAARPQLHVASLRPFAVDGTGFRAGERVRVTVRADADVAARSDDADVRGRIGVRFRAITLRDCTTYLVSARGDKGSWASLRSVPRPCGTDR